MTRVVAHYAAVWAVAFIALMLYWHAYESAEPGIQYADPLLPCAWLATWPAWLWAVGYSILKR